MSPAELKVKAYRDFCQPLTKKHIRQFWGLTGYYRRFVQNYAEHSFLLTEATKKSAPDRVLWCDAMLDEFKYLQNLYVVFLL